MVNGIEVAGTAAIGGAEVTAGGADCVAAVVVVGYEAVGAAAIVVAEEAGIEDSGGTEAIDGGATGEVPGDVAGTEFCDGGVEAAVSDCGVASVEGSTGAAGSAGVAPSALRAMSELSVAGASFFHQASFCGIWAQRGPDWQPATASATSATHKT